VQHVFSDDLRDRPGTRSETLVMDFPSRLSAPAPLTALEIDLKTCEDGLNRPF
jgi:hypothetical protein